LWTGATAAFSHVYLETPTAAAGSNYKAVFVVGHGCNESPTTAIAVQIPEGFEVSRHEAKPGWAVATQPARFVRPDGSQGKQSSDIGAVTWTMSSREVALANATANTFVLHGKVPAQAGPLWFKVRQTCEQGESNWADIPAPGVSAKALKTPAVLLEVGPGAAGAHQHHRH
jgi:hypothetical protein